MTFHVIDLLSFLESWKVFRYVIIFLSWLPQELRGSEKFQLLATYYLFDYNFIVVKKFYGGKGELSVFSEE